MAFCFQWSFTSTRSENLTVSPSSYLFLYGSVKQCFKVNESILFPWVYVFLFNSHMEKVCCYDFHQSEFSLSIQSCFLGSSTCCRPVPPSWCSFLPSLPFPNWKALNNPQGWDCFYVIKTVCASGRALPSECDSKTTGTVAIIGDSDKNEGLERLKHWGYCFML